MKLIEKIKNWYGYVMFNASLHTVKNHNDKTIIIYLGEVLYKGENYDQRKAKGDKVHILNITSDYEDGRTRKEIEEVLNYYGLV